MEKLELYDVIRVSLVIRTHVSRDAPGPFEGRSTDWASAPRPMWLFFYYILSAFFAQSMHIKLALPQGAWLSVFFIGKSEVLHLHQGPELRMYYWYDREAKKKAQHPAGFEPMISWVFALLACALPQCHNCCPTYSQPCKAVFGAKGLSKDSTFKKKEIQLLKAHLIFNGF